MADETIPRSPSGRRLLWSERKRLAETGSLGDLVSDEVPPPLRIALADLLGSQNSLTGPVAAIFRIDLETLCVERFGVPRGQAVATIVATGTLDQVLDLVELAWESLGGPLGEDYHDPEYRRQVAYRTTTFERRINNLFGLHRFGFVVEDGRVRQVISPALEVEVVGPALLAAQRPGWEEVERTYREALDHLRGGEIDDALTAANAAAEAALKAMGLSGDRLNPLLKDLQRSGKLAGYAASTPGAVAGLIDRLMAWRGEGDAHGKAPGAPEPPRELAALAVHWAGAVIVYLAEVDRGRSTWPPG